MNLLHTHRLASDNPAPGTNAHVRATSVNEKSFQLFV